MSKMASLDQKYQNLGAVFHLIEQFELISRTDLAKLSGYAPATITLLTKALIEHKFILERTSQNLPSRGRPAVGLAISPFHWHFLCLTLAENKLTISLCELSGQAVYQRHYPHNVTHYVDFAEHILTCLQNFTHNYPLDHTHLLAISISVIGKIDANRRHILQLGSQPLNCPLVEKLAQHYSLPIFLNEHFQLWLLAESTLGSLMSDDNVIFLQLDQSINLSVLFKGKLLHQHEQKRMNVNKMMMPRFSPLSDEIAQQHDEITRYQLANQISFSALVRLIDRYLPNKFELEADKINWFCTQVEQQQPQALQIMEHLTDNIAYMLMNLINIFSSEKIMFNSPLLRIKTLLFEQISKKLRQHLLLPELHIDLVTSRYDWDSPFIPATAIKIGIYEGSLIKDIIPL